MQILYHITILFARIMNNRYVFRTFFNFSRNEWTNRNKQTKLIKNAYFPSTGRLNDLNLHQPR